MCLFAAKDHHLLFAVITCQVKLSVHKHNESDEGL